MREILLRAPEKKPVDKQFKSRGWQSHGGKKKVTKSGVPYSVYKKGGRKKGLTSVWLVTVKTLGFVQVMKTVQPASFRAGKKKKIVLNFLQITVNFSSFRRG